MIKIFTSFICVAILFSCAENKNDTSKNQTWYDFSKVDSLKNIYGTWESIEDSLALISFYDSVATMGYKGTNPSMDNYKTNYIFDVDRSIDKLILVDAAGDTLSYGINLLGADTLEMVYLDRGNTLLYKRSKP